MSETETAPVDLWNEDGDRLWLRYDQAPTAAKARYRAWTGSGLPTGFNEGGTRLIDLTVRVVYCRPGTQEEDTWTDGMWWACERDHPEAVRYWEVCA